MSTENNVYAMPVPDNDAKSSNTYSESYIATLVGHVPLNTWCEFERCTVNAIDTRLSKGIWQMGVHVIKPKGGKRMVNLKAAKRWLEGKHSQRE